MHAHPLEARMAHLEGVQQIGERLSSIDRRLDSIDGRFNQVDSRFAQIDASLCPGRRPLRANRYSV